MLIRFHKVEYDIEHHCFDYDNAEYLCAQYRKDYVEFIKLINLMQSNDNDDIEPTRSFGNIMLTYDDKNGKRVEDMFSIADVQLSIPKDKSYMTCIEVFVYEN